MPKSKQPARKAIARRSKAKARITRRPAAAKVSAPSAALQYIPWHTIPLEDLNPLLQRQFVVGQEIMLARVLLKKGCIVPLHSHHNEQLSYVIEGALKFKIHGKDTIVQAGEVLTIPPHVPHLVKALRDSVTIDVFHPPRMDWINKTDTYLRK